MDHGLRASYWTRWPDEVGGPLWAGIHLHRRAGVTVVVGVELFTEPPASARTSLGPAEAATDLHPVAPVSLRAADVDALGLRALLDRFRASSEGAAALAGLPGTRSKRYGVDHWQRVAAHHRTLVAQGERRTAYKIAEHWTISHVTAKRWIARARAEGFLEPVQHRR